MVAWGRGATAAVFGIGRGRHSQGGPDGGKSGLPLTFSDSDRWKTSNGCGFAVLVTRRWESLLVWASSGGIRWLVAGLAIAIMFSKALAVWLQTLLIGPTASFGSDTANFPLYSEVARWYASGVTAVLALMATKSRPHLLSSHTLILPFSNCSWVAPYCLPSLSSPSYPSPPSCHPCFPPSNKQLLGRPILSPVPIYSFAGAGAAITITAVCIRELNGRIGIGATCMVYALCTLSLLVSPFLFLACKPICLCFDTSQTLHGLRPLRSLAASLAVDTEWGAHARGLLQRILPRGSGGVAANALAASAGMSARLPGRLQLLGGCEGLWFPPASEAARVLLPSATPLYLWPPASMGVRYWWWIGPLAVPIFAFLLFWYVLPPLLPVPPNAAACLPARVCATGGGLVRLPCPYSRSSYSGKGRACPPLRFPSSGVCNSRLTPLAFTPTAFHALSCSGSGQAVPLQERIYVHAIALLTNSQEGGLARPQRNCLAFENSQRAIPKWLQDDCILHSQRAPIPLSCSSDGLALGCKRESPCRPAVLLRPSSGPSSTTYLLARSAPPSSPHSSRPSLPQPCQASRGTAGASLSTCTATCHSDGLAVALQEGVYVQYHLTAVPPTCSTTYLQYHLPAVPPTCSTTYLHSDILAVALQERVYLQFGLPFTSLVHYVSAWCSLACQSPPCQSPPCQSPPCQSPPCQSPPCQSPPCQSPPCQSPPCQSPPCQSPPCQSPPCQSPPWCTTSPPDAPSCTTPRTTPFPPCSSDGLAVALQERVYLQYDLPVTSLVLYVSTSALFVDFWAFAFSDHFDRAFGFVFDCPQCLLYLVLASVPSTLAACLTASQLLRVPPSALATFLTALLLRVSGGLVSSLVLRVSPRPSASRPRLLLSSPLPAPSLLKEALKLIGAAESLRRAGPLSRLAGGFLSLLRSLPPSSLPPSLLPSLPPSSLPSLPLSSLPSLPPPFPPSLLPSLPLSSLPSLPPPFPPSLLPSPPPSSLPSRTPPFPPSLLPSLPPSSLPSLPPPFPPSLLPSLPPSSLPSLPPPFPPSPAPSVPLCPMQVVMILLLFPLDPLHRSGKCLKFLQAW
ncbi:unnamed protein product [Closterium sp. NIES-65]|nr:unnamed protein product [Closterium sp. NIES-65]